MRTGVVVVLLAALATLLSGCLGSFDSGRPRAEGLIRIQVRPSIDAERVAPKLVPGAATAVRVRVWHPTTGRNVVATIPIGPSPQSMDIAVPAGQGYVVDAVSYYMQGGRALALTGGCASRVDVTADELTPVKLSLRPWRTDVTGPDMVEPEADLSIRVSPSDGGGLLTRETFASATLHYSFTSYQDSKVSLPGSPATQGVVMDDRILFSAKAPSATEEKTLYVNALLRLSSNWDDPTRAASGDAILHLELPNRHQGETLYELTVAPVAGGIDVEITSAAAHR